VHKNARLMSTGRALMAGRLEAGQRYTGKPPGRAHAGKIITLHPRTCLDVGGP
jgi:hypothetical protein